eukprot:3940417-Rhodomonas_salina.3
MANQAAGWHRTMDERLGDLIVDEAEDLSFSSSAFVISDTDPHAEGGIAQGRSQPPCPRSWCPGSLAQRDMEHRHHPMTSQWTMMHSPQEDQCAMSPASSAAHTRRRSGCMPWLVGGQERASPHPTGRTETEPPPRVVSRL